MEIKSPDYDLTKEIIRSAIEVHKTIGPGLKEEVYEAALEWELQQSGINVQRQVKCPVVYKGIKLNTHREDKSMDMLVEGRVVVELKATPVMDPIFRAQCLTYVKMLGVKTGLVLNFGRVTLKEGIAHVINESREECRRRLLRESPQTFRALLIEEDGVSPEEANRMQMAGDLGLAGKRACRA